MPTQEQRVFIFTHYPTCSREDLMIAKIYELYADASTAEQLKAQSQAAYGRPSKKQAAQAQAYEEELIDEEDTTFGSAPTKQNKKTAKKQDQAAAQERKQKLPKVTKDKTEGQEEAKKAKVAKQVKDIEVQEDENICDVDEARQPCSFVFIGHVDAGKSTICGNLVYQMGIVDTRTIEKYKKEAKDKGRDSWWLAYVMDNTDEEKAKGKTVEIGRAMIDTDHKQYTIFDAPGHKNYVPNMIMGAALADFGGLVISARKGEFEAGFEKDGQTREHIQLAKSLGIQKLVIVVNKMDEQSVQWKRERWDEIRTNLTPFLLKSGYREEDLFWVPISGLTGQNILEPIGNACNWYNGPTLVQILDQLPVENRNAQAPLRIPVLDKMKEQRMVVHGKVEQGTVRLGDKLALAPSNIPCQVLNIVNGKQQQVRYARPGDNVQIKISNVEEDLLNKGDVLCPRDTGMPTSQLFEAELELLELLEYKPIFSRGYQCMIHIHTYADEISVKNLIWSKEKDPASGQEVQKDQPKFTRSFSKALVRIATKVPIAMEKLADCPQLARFTLRDEGKTIAVGHITRYIPINKEAAAKARTRAAPGEEAKTDPSDVIQAPGATDKHATIVFNFETGTTEQAAKPLDGIAEDDGDE